MAVTIDVERLNRLVSSPEEMLELAREELASLIGCTWNEAGRIERVLDGIGPVSDLAPDTRVMFTAPSVVFRTTAIGIWSFADVMAATRAALWARLRNLRVAQEHGTWILAGFSARLVNVEQFEREKRRGLMVAGDVLPAGSSDLDPTLRDEIERKTQLPSRVAARRSTPSIEVALAWIDADQGPWSDPFAKNSTNPTLRGELHDVAAAGLRGAEGIERLPRKYRIRRQNGLELIEACRVELESAQAGAAAAAREAAMRSAAELSDEQLEHLLAKRRASARHDVKPQTADGAELRVTGPAVPAFVPTPEEIEAGLKGKGRGAR